MYQNTHDYEDILLDASSVSESSSVRPNQIRDGRGSCAICGVKAIGINFQVLTCSSCKAFFRRNGVKPLHRFNCRSSGDCKIDERSRRQCTACRLRKCFAMGMVKECIRTEEQNQRHRELVEKNRRQKLKKSQQQQQEQNTSKMLEERRCQTVCIKSSCLLSKTYLKQINFIFELFLESTREMISEDFILRFDYDLTNVINLYCTPVWCLITFLKQLSQFQQLTIDDRLILLKNNTKILLPILTHLLNTTSGVQIRVDHPGLHNINNKIVCAYSLFACRVPDDNKLLALLIVVFLFCPCLLTNDSLYDAGYINTQSRQLIQCAYDEYTQLVWYYIIGKYVDDEHQAVLTYMKIVTTILHLQIIVSEIYDIVECSVEIDQLHMMMQSILHLT